MSVLPLALPVVAVLAVAAGAGGLAISVRRLLALVRRPPLARVPLVAEQEVTLDAAGSLVLAIEGPIGTTAFAGLGVVLEDAAHGRPVALRPIVVRTRTADFGRARLSWKRFDLAAPARLRVRLTGLDPARDVRDCALLVARPLGARLPVTIAAVVVSGILVVAGLVAVGLALR